MQATEGADVIQAIHSDSATNYGIWFVEKEGKKSVLKLQESGPGGLAQVRAGLDESKVSYQINLSELLGSLILGL